MLKLTEPVISNTKEARKRRNRQAKLANKSNYVVIFLKRQADFIEWLELENQGVFQDQNEFWDYAKVMIKSYDRMITAVQDTCESLGYTRFYGARSPKWFVNATLGDVQNRSFVKHTSLSHSLWGKTFHPEFIEHIDPDGCGGFMPFLILFDPESRDLDNFY